MARLEKRLVARDAEIARKDGFILFQADRIDEMTRSLEEVRRAGKRQAAPFSKGNPKKAPKRPGRKSGVAHGRHGHRPLPDREPDRTLDAPLPACCPDCGGQVLHERDADQFQLDVPGIRPTLTRFKVAIGRCQGCKARVQGRHPEQTSDALGAAGSQLGPQLKAWGMWLHYRMGLSFGKVSAVLAHLGVNVTAGAIAQASAKAASTDLVPVHAELVRVANASKAITMDESGWRVGGQGRWLWVAANDEVTLAWWQKAAASPRPPSGSTRTTPGCWSATDMSSTTTTATQRISLVSLTYNAGPGRWKPTSHERTGPSRPPPRPSSPMLSPPGT